MNCQQINKKNFLVVSDKWRKYHKYANILRKHHETFTIHGKFRDVREALRSPRNFKKVLSTAEHFGKL